MPTHYFQNSQSYTENPCLEKTKTKTEQQRKVAIRQALRGLERILKQRNINTKGLMQPGAGNILAIRAKMAQYKDT